MESEAQTPPAANVKPGPRYFFLHLLSMATLYTSAISFLVLIFQYINLAFPDVLEGAGSYAILNARSSIRWSVASLVVVFPVYIWVNWYLNKRYAVAPELRAARSRRWLVYFTLFVAALIIIGDLVALIYQFLGGELTVRFILKVLTVLFVAGSVFLYYVWDLRRHKVE